MFIELHILQNFAPSNLNRDDTGSPKDCIFGGVRRARISSQCLKRAMREAPVFQDTTGVGNGKRTKSLIEQLLKHLPEERRTAGKGILEELVPAFLSKLDKDGERTAVLLYISPAEMAAIAQSLEERWSELIDETARKPAIAQITRDLTRQFKGRTSAPDIALFGRMLAEYPDLNIDAACQVAHALSTHRVTMEMDFYTAVDELQPAEETGAGMMGFTGYDSACFYRYARLDWDQLATNLAGDAELAMRTVKGFILAAIEAVPSGKQNTFAANNPPSLVFAAVRKGGMGWSLANAFECPVNADRQGGYVAPSARALDECWSRFCTAFGEHTVAAAAVLALDSELPLARLAEHRVSNIDAFVERVLAALPAQGGAA